MWQLFATARPSLCAVSMIFVAFFRFRPAGLLTNRAKHGCRDDERYPRVPVTFCVAPCEPTRTGREPARVACFLPRGDAQEEGGRDECEEARGRPTGPRVGGVAAPVRVAGAGALRADPTPGALRRLGGRAGPGGGNVVQHALPEARPLRRRRYGVPLRCPDGQAEAAAALGQAPHLGPESRVPALQPQRDSQSGRRGLRQEARRPLHRARARGGADAA